MTATPTAAEEMRLLIEYLRLHPTLSEGEARRELGLECGDTEDET